VKNKNYYKTMNKIYPKIWLEIKEALIFIKNERQGF